MKYLIIIICIVFIHILFRREGLYSKNIVIHESTPTVDNITDNIGITTDQLKTRAENLNEKIYDEPKKLIYLDSISLLS